MEEITNFIISEYESKHYDADEMLETNNKLIEWLADSNDMLREQWGIKEK